MGGSTRGTACKVCLLHSMRGRSLSVRLRNEIAEIKATLAGMQDAG